MKRPKRVGIQYAALPYQMRGGRVWVLLISSRRTRRWVIPKGWPMAGCRPYEAAAIEAHEEAGLEGEITEQPFGSYNYMKEMKAGEVLAVQVLVFPFAAERQAPSFKEEGQRTATWFPYRHAAGLVAEPGLRRLILDFGAAQSTNPLIRGLRRYRTWRFGAQAGDLPI